MFGTWETVGKADLLKRCTNMHTVFDEDLIRLLNRNKLPNIHI